MNKKLIYISLSSFFIITSADASSLKARKDSGVYVSLNAGSCIPLGYFKSPTYLDMGGYALNGYGANIELEHPLKPGWLGLAFETGYYDNPFSLQAYKEVINPYLSPYSYIYYSATPYKEIPTLGGIFFEKTFKRVTMEFKCEAGVDYITFPNVNSFQVEITTFPLLSNIPGAAVFMGQMQSSTLYVYSLETSIRYTLSKHFDLRGSASYFNNFLSHPDLNVEPTSYRLGYITLSQLHIAMGLAYHI